MSRSLQSSAQPDEALHPRVEDLRREGATLRIDARVPGDLAFFAGHFPGEPVLPGFVHLYWVAEWARTHLGVCAPWTGIEALKFREPLLPEQRFSVHIELEDEAEGSDDAPVLRFACRRGDRVVSEGRLRGRAENDTPAASASSTPTTASATAAAHTRANEAPLPLRLPQRGAMRLVTRVLSHGAGTTLCEARVGETHPLVHQGRASVWLALELLAQGMAAQGGLALQGVDVTRAWVVGARRIALRCGGFSSGEPLWLRADHVRGETGLVVCDCALGAGAPPEGVDEADLRALARGRLTAFVEADRRAAPSATPSPDRSPPNSEEVREP